MAYGYLLYKRLIIKFYCRIKSIDYTAPASFTVDGSAAICMVPPSPAGPAAGMCDYDCECEREKSEDKWEYGG